LHFRVESADIDNIMFFNINPKLLILLDYL
jgi:hypothetical protein